MDLVLIKKGRVRTGVMGIALILMLCSPAGAGLITDPDLASGPGDVIDPAGDGEDADVSFGTAQTTLEARSDLRVLQTFTGFTSGGTNIASFTDSSWPGIRFTFSGNFSDTTAGLEASGNVLFRTSDSSYLQQKNSSAGISTLTIEFGTWDGAFTADQKVAAAAFCLAQVYAPKSGTVTFRDENGTAISGATFSYAGVSDFDGSGNQKDFYFGWDAAFQSSVQIGSVTITFEDASTPWTSGFDDFAFTTSIVDPPVIELSTNQLAVVEGSTNSFGVKLDIAPANTVTVNVSRASGDTDITVQSGSTLFFTPANATNWQYVTLAAAEDGDWTNGVANVTCVDSGAVYESAAITVEELDNDNDPPNVNAGPDQTVVPQVLIPWTPAEIETTVWFDAADSNTITANGGSVSEWLDKSGNSNHASQVSTSLQPVTGTETINGLNTLVSRASVGEYMGLSSNVTLSDFSIFGVLKAASDPVDMFTTMGVLALNENSWDSYTMTFTTPNLGVSMIRAEDDSGASDQVDFGACTTLTTPFLYSNVRIKSSTNSTYYYNGDTGTTGSFLTNDLSLGVLFRGYAGEIGGNGQPWDGRVGEIVIVSSALSDTERQKIEGYLAHKWKMAANLPQNHPYKSIPPGTIAEAQLDGTVTDPQGNPFTVAWTKEIGPASITFTNSATVDTTAFFQATGDYTLRLTAVDSGFETNYDECIVTVKANTVSMPLDLVASAISTSQISLVWVDNSTNESGVVIERSSTSGSGFSQLAAAAANATNYTDTSVSAGATWYYRVAATNSESSSIWSGEASATTPKMPATISFGSLSQTYDGTTRFVTYTTSPTGLTVNVTYNGSETAPVYAGSYTVVGTVADGGYEGTTNATLTVGQLGATVTNWPAASPITEGQPLGDSTLTGGDTSVPGSFSFVYPSVLPPVGTNSVAVMFMPADWFGYTSVSGSVDVVVSENLSSSWRSSLYPESWTPPDTNKSFYADALIQDFSYAGYRKGEDPIPEITNPIFDVTSYGADSSGTTDSTAEIQAAIDAASSAGGGVVYMPAGMYKVAPVGANNYALQITTGNIVLRGAGVDQTYILNTNYVMRSKKIIKVAAAVSLGPWVSITQDLNGPTRRIPVADAAEFSVGDKVLMDWTFTQEWINEHNQGTWWSEGITTAPANAEYLREVTAVNTGAGWIEIDIPTRYTMKVRDGARVARSIGMISGVGIEDFSIANVQHPGAGFAEEDYAVEGTVGYDVHGSWLIDVRNVFDSWIRRVHTFLPAGNTRTCHLLSNGIQLADSTRVTVQDCYLKRPEYGGGGGNGYMYRIGIAHENLLLDCAAEFSRHGFVISSPGTSGNVFRGCEDRETGRATGTGAGYTTAGSGSDNHMHFSHSNMYDGNHASNSFWTAHHRLTSGTIYHALTSAHGVYWNISGSGTRYSTIVVSEQGRYGYIIGTSGSRSGASNPTGGNTSPADIIQGVGIGDTLSPQSLYLDQLARRMKGILVDAGSQITLLSTNPAVALSGSVYTYGDEAVVSVWSQVSGPSAVFADTNSLSTTVACNNTGTYVFKLTAWDSAHTNEDQMTVTVLDGEVGGVVRRDSIVGEAQALAPTPDYYVNVTNDLSGATGSSLSTNRENRVLVLGFALPALPQGQTLSSASLNFEITKARDQQGIDPSLNVYLLNTSEPSGSGTSYFYYGPSNSTAAAKFVGGTYLDVGTTDVTYADDEKDQVYTLSGDALVLLQSFYGGDNIPDQSNAFFRFNLDKTWDYQSGTPYQRYYIDLAADESMLVVSGTGSMVTAIGAVPYVWMSTWTNEYESSVTNDWDGDNLTTLQEYWSGTDPTDSNSFFQIGRIYYDGSNIVLEWQHSYVDTNNLPPICIQKRSSLMTGDWIYVDQKFPVDGTNTWQNGLPQDGFYRLCVTNVP